MQKHTHTDSNEYPIVAFSKNATIISALSNLTGKKTELGKGLLKESFGNYRGDWV